MVGVQVVAVNPETSRRKVVNKSCGLKFTFRQSDSRNEGVQPCLPERGYLRGCVLRRGGTEWRKSGAGKRVQYILQTR